MHRWESSSATVMHMLQLTFHTCLHIYITATLRCLLGCSCRQQKKLSRGFHTLPGPSPHPQHPPAGLQPAHTDPRTAQTVSLGFLTHHPGASMTLLEPFSTPSGTPQGLTADPQGSPPTPLGTNPDPQEPQGSLTDFQASQRSLLGTLRYLVGRSTRPFRALKVLLGLQADPTKVPPETIIPIVSCYPSIIKGCLITTPGTLRPASETPCPTPQTHCHILESAHQTPGPGGPRDPLPYPRERMPDPRDHRDLWPHPRDHMLDPRNGQPFPKDALPYTRHPI